MRQLVSLVFERVVAEDEQTLKSDKNPAQINVEDLKVPSGTPPKGKGYTGGQWIFILSSKIKYRHLRIHQLPLYLTIKCIYGSFHFLTLVDF